ncbi:MAG: methyltransferase domain-containing protein [Candidatus Hodarchaeales archaeon]|jgi:SAM-dependent methyltransferase
MVTNPISKHKCICGNNSFTKYEKQLYKVNNLGETTEAEDSKIKFGSCTKCGIVKQISDVSLENYGKYYLDYPPTKDSYKAKSYEHDKEIAKKRCDEYGINKELKQRILDVGSGSGAFVTECREREQEAFGCEISEYAYAPENEFIYYDEFEEINFPTDYFDRVTCHDVLEHSLNPKRFLKELHRTTKQEGTCVIEIPRFFHDAGKHHWKEEHIWFFKVEELSILAKEAGFKLEDIKCPIDSKVVLYLHKPKETRIKILMPPGLGDSYWSVIKTQAFMKKKNLGDVVDAHIVCNKEMHFNGHQRAFPFLQMFPFLNATWETIENKGDPVRRGIWMEAYARQGRTIFENIFGHDYFISYNGHLRFGAEMEKLDPDLKTNWYPPMFVSLEQRRFEKECKEKFGKYMALYFVFGGTYEHWTKEFPVRKVIKSINKIYEETGLTPVFVGAKWDEQKDPLLNEVKKGVGNHIDMTGKTTVEQAFGLMKGSEVVVGYPSGLTVLSAVIGAKTVIIWNYYYNSQFAWNCCPPDTRNKNYFITNTKELTARALTDKVKEALAK